jgi:hypothetical protein
VAFAPSLPETIEVSVAVAVMLYTPTLPIDKVIINAKISETIFFI